MWCEILAAIDVAKADELLALAFDESDKNNNSILNVMTTIRTGKTIKQFTLNGITLMAVKTSESNSESIVQTYAHAREWLQECHTMYAQAGAFP